jgi:membrane-associated phospholipid phosphatase
MSELAQGAIVVVTIAGIFLYFYTNRIDAPGRWFFQDTWLDEYIPLVPYFVIPYVALYPYIIITLILLLNSPFRTQGFAAFALAAWTAALFWYFFPAGILRKREIGPGLLPNMIIWLYTHDHENNTIPSSHVFYAILCSFYLCLLFPHYWIVFAILGALISVSTVLVKQHHLADIFGGIVWGVGAILLAQILVA